MTVQELMTILEDFDGNTEVRIMIQETYPLQSTVLGVWADDPGTDDDTDEAKDSPVLHASASGEPAQGNVLYIVEGRQLGYGVKRAWSEVLV